jgi:hypothetical protein
MYDLQKILLDNYCAKNSLLIVRKETDRDGTLRYHMGPEWIGGYLCKYSSITAQALFPDRFGIYDECTDQEQFYPCEY